MTHNRGGTVCAQGSLLCKQVGWGGIGNTLLAPHAAILDAFYSNPGEASETLSLPHHQHTTMGMRKAGEGSQPALRLETFLGALRQGAASLLLAFGIRSCFSSREHLICSELRSVEGHQISGGKKKETNIKYEMPTLADPQVRT